jgi:hypothetical protein
VARPAFRYRHARDGFDYDGKQRTELIEAGLPVRKLGRGRRHGCRSVARVLSEEQLRDFGDEGYLVLPGVVPERLLAPVDAEINALVAQNPPPADAGSAPSYSRPPGRLPACDAALRDSLPIIHCSRDSTRLAVEQALFPILARHRVPRLRPAHDPGPGRWGWRVASSAASACAAATSPCCWTRAGTGVLDRKPGPRRHNGGGLGSALGAASPDPGPELLVAYRPGTVAV